jgi:Na+-translocating ferredoxin:NAD+ oxidoreductase RnfG subunit
VQSTRIGPSLAAFCAANTEMDAETKRLIQVEIQNTLTDSQNTMMTEIIRLISSEMSNMQRQNQVLADKQLSKIEESMTDTYKLNKKRGNE